MDKKIAQLLKLSGTSQNFIGKSIQKILPSYIAEEILSMIEKALETEKSLDMKFFLQFNENQIMFRTDIVPIGKTEVLAFLQNITRTW